ncbi:MAG: DNA translocase FtsK [Chloroflexi bacterium]|nr:DNA translocase FtsK [Chloroflexota bacterium]
MSGFELPSEILTEERATYFRNAPCAKPALLLANTGDDEEQSLREVSSIGAPDLLARADLWVLAACKDLAILDDVRRWWEKALKGLNDQNFVNLDRYANYVLRTKKLIEEEGLPFDEALDSALPALRLPKKAGQFRGMAPGTRGQVAKWRAQYKMVQSKYSCYLIKQNPSGVMLNEDELRIAFERVKNDIPEKYHQVISDFIAAPGGWTPQSANLSECEWEDIRPLFDGLRREKFNLGKATLDFYKERNPELLTTIELDYIERLSRRRSSEADIEDDRQFYDAHRDELREDRKLKSAWDRFVFGTLKETHDFLSGLVTCMEGFSWETPCTNRKLLISCDSLYRKDLRNLNVDAGLYFARRYAGLKELLGRHVEWNVGALFKFPDLIEEWKVRGQQLNRSEAKATLQLKFFVTLEFKTLDGADEQAVAQFIWRYNPQWIASEFVNDWNRLVTKPFIICRANRESTSSKGAAQNVDLWNVRTLMAAYGQDRGSLVGVYKKANDLKFLWHSKLDEAKSKNLISVSNAEQLATEFERFAREYEAAVIDFKVTGLSSLKLEDQVTTYGTLLESICCLAQGDRNRQLLLRPILQLGTVGVEGGRPTAIIAPWHPLRLAAMARKARRFANVIRTLLTTQEIEFGDPRLFFSELREELAHIHYPEVVLGWQDNQPELLALTDTAGDYSLHESPLAADAGADDTNENPSEGATLVVELVQRYLKLHPHEQANLSVVLYNCDSSRLPLAVVDKFGRLYQDDEDTRCQIVLRHRDPKQLSWLYEQIVDASDGDGGDRYVASEATQDFMARLRIGISADQAPPPDPLDGCPQDIVFLQDVIARHARLDWYLVNSQPADPASLNPAQWSRRRPATIGDMKSTVYLCCPVQRAEAWAHLTAVTTFFKGDWNSSRETRLLPARQLDFRDSTTAKIFEETHNLASWVVNYDELLDRRQLIEQKVQIIRYKHIATQGRNLIISSMAPMGLLRSMVVNRLRNLDLGISNNDITELATRFINDANDVSGDIVLRAAQRGQSASELIGIVLSRYLISYELGHNQSVGWFFLDDYADWLGQKEEQIADLLVLHPTFTPENKMLLVVIITEAKYIDFGGLASKRKESHKQLRDTLKRVAGAVISTPPRLDRDIWLARLSDLLVDGIRLPSGAPLDLSKWQRAIRDGQCILELRGYSHVFISGPSDAVNISAHIRLPEAKDGFDAHQEVFGRDHVRELVLRYYHRGDPMGVRREIDVNYWDLVTSNNHYRPGQSQSSIDYQSGKVTNNDRNQKNDIDVNIPSDSFVTESHNSAVEKIENTNDSAIVIIEPVPSADKLKTDSESGVRESQKWAFPSILKWIQEIPRDIKESEEDQSWLRQVETTTKIALQQFKLQAKLVHSVLTPNAALLKFQGSSLLTIDQVTRRRTEFLTTHGLNLIGVQPEPGVVSLSIARPGRQTVSLRQLWQRWTPDVKNGNQDLLIGVREDDGTLLILSPGSDHAPHTLIAGTTGSGKSVLVQNIILSIAATNLPEQARITIIDPKQGVDYFTFESLPHLDGGIIDQQDTAINRIQTLITEMDNRYVLMRKARVQNFRAYNEKVSSGERLPALWLIHDEFAEWMLSDEYKQEVSSSVQRLGVKARAAGIYLVFAAQRPEANVVPMQLRANLGNRLILRVDSEGTSEIALGERGAERLLGRGHLLAKLEGNLSLVYAQVPYVTPDEIDDLVKLLRSDNLY